MSSRPGLTPLPLPPPILSLLSSLEALIVIGNDSFVSTAAAAHAAASSELAELLESAVAAGSTPAHLVRQIRTMLLRHFPTDSTGSTLSPTMADPERVGRAKKLQRSIGDLSSMRAQVRLVARELVAANSLPSSVGSLRLEDVLDCGPLRRHFTNHLNDCLSSENLEFYLALRSYRDVSEEATAEVRLRHAQDVWRRFLDPTAQQQVNVPGRAKSLTEGRICAAVEGRGVVESSVFTEMEEDLLKMLRGTIIDFASSYRSQIESVLPRYASDARSQMRLVRDEAVKAGEKLAALLEGDDAAQALQQVHTAAAALDNLFDPLTSPPRT